MSAELPFNNSSTEIPPASKIPPPPEIPPAEKPVEKPPVLSESGEKSANESSEKPAEKVTDILSGGNKSFFSKMSEKASALMEDAYKGLYEIPIVNRLVGKFEIGFNQFWADKHENKAVALKGEIDSFSGKISGLDESKRGLLSVVEDLKRDGMPGSESILIKLRDLDRQKENYLNKKDKIQSKLEARKGKVEGYMQERDLVANRLVEYYDRELGPMDKQLEKLDMERGELELSVTVTEIRHRQLGETLSSLEQRKDKLEKALKASGMEEKDIKKFGAVEQWNELIYNGRERIRKDKELLAEQRIALDKRVSKAEAKADPYRDEREEFVRVTKRGRIDIKVPPKIEGKPFEGRKDIDQETGTPLPKTEYRETTRARDVIQGETLPAGGFMAEGVENAESREDRRPTLENYVTQWNMLPGNIKNLNLLPKIDTVDFFRTIKGITKEFKMSMPEFKKVLAGYYKVKGKLTEPAKAALDRAFPAWEYKIRQDEARNKS